MWRHSAVDVDPEMVLEPVSVPAQPHPPVPGLQLHAGLEPGRSSDEMIRFTRDNGLQALKRVRHRHQPHDPQHGNGGFFTPLPTPRVPHRGIRVRRLRLIGYSPNILKTIFSPRSGWVYGSRERAARIQHGADPPGESPSANAGWSRANISACRTPRASEQYRARPTPALRS